MQPFNTENRSVQSWRRGERSGRFCLKVMRGSDLEAFREVARSGAALASSWLWKVNYPDDALRGRFSSHPEFR